MYAGRLNIALLILPAGEYNPTNNGEPKTTNISLGMVLIIPEI